MIAAIVTAYKPDAYFNSRFTPLLSVCSTIIVSDNTPGGHSFIDLPAGFTILRNLQNLGIAQALNRGIKEAIRQGARVVILFDQDSTPSAAFVSSMVSRLDDSIAVHGQRCCVGPKHVDDTGLSENGQAVLKRTNLLSEAVSREVTCLPTSGMVFLPNALTQDDLFSDEFFLDLVDFEWCWRLRSRGWHFSRSIDVQMFHRLGIAERRFLGFTFHVPAPYRHYFQFRDSLRLTFKADVPIYSKLRLIGILPLKMLVYPFILDRGFERLCWMCRGCVDYALRVSGVGAAATRLSR